jgi:hypothetical protein
MLADKSDLQIESTVSGNRVAMTLDETALVHIMSVLTNLYSDPEKAIIREYATNAWDAHIEAGILRPIEITTPSNLAPFLTIQDYGIGLDEDGIRRIYSKYGASTKRESNDFNGQLGMGCKSALAYTGQFTVIGIKNGIRTQVLVTKDEDGGSMTVVSEEPTDEGNGVTVQIPVKPYNNIDRKAKAFFRFWQPGTVLLNGADPTGLNSHKITDDLLMIPNEGQDWLVMGNVPYPVTFNHGLNGYNVVAYVPIGDVAFAPSREALNYDKKQTKETLHALEIKIKESIPGAVQRQVDEAKTAVEAMRAANIWREALGRIRMKYTYRKSEIPGKFFAPENQKDKDGNWQDNRFVVSAANSTILSRVSKERAVAAGTIADGLLVYGYDLKFTAGHKKKLKMFAEQEGLKVEHFVLCRKKPKHLRWVDKERIVHWEIVKAIKLPTHWTKPANAGRLPGSFDLIIDGKKHKNVAADDIDASKGLFYRAINGNTFPKDREGEADYLVRQLHPGCTIALLAINRVDKFRRTFPQAVSSREAIKADYDALVSQITKNDRLAKAIKDDYYGRASLQMIDPEKVKDPEIKKAIELLKLGTAKTDALNKFGRLLHYIGAKRSEITVEWNSPLEDYPLWEDSHMRKNPDHMYAYLNSAFPIVKKARIEARREARKAHAEAKKNRSKK